MNRIIDNLNDLAKFKRILLLYSGGVDSSYALLWCLKKGIQVIALRCIDDTSQTPDVIKLFLQKSKIKLVEIDYSSELVDDFISRGILAGGFYQDRFPISSSYSRPLIAKLAVTIAEENDCKCIVHTSNFHQNSAARFNNSVIFHSSDIVVAIPYIKSNISREQKLIELRESDCRIEGSAYSIDQNIWCRVIENGDLDDLAHPVSAKHFEWTNNHEVQEATSIKLSFREGLPVALNDESKDLRSLIQELNRLGSLYGIGRFNGVEDTLTGVKNHEVREAPAAQIIYCAKRFLESCVLTQSELKLKTELDYRWTELVVNGNWYSLEKESLDLAIKKLNSVVTGTIDILLQHGSVFPQAVSSAFALDFTTLDADISWAKEKLSYAEYFHIHTIPNRRRAKLS